MMRDSGCIHLTLLYGRKRRLKRDILSVQEHIEKTEAPIRSGFRFVGQMVPAIGLEPTTAALRMRCSTN